MIKHFRHHFFLQLFWGLMALYLLNLSIDTPDSRSQYLVEDLSINDQESIIEFVLEKVLGLENIIKEYDDPDTDDQNKKKNTNHDLVLVFEQLHNSTLLYRVPSLQNPTELGADISFGYVGTEVPPPKDLV